MDTTTRSTWIIAGAVIFAGLLIAVGVFFGGQSANNDSADGADSGSDGVIAAAEAAGLDTDALQSCLETDEFQSDVQGDVNDASNAGGRGTPYNVLVLNDPLSSGTQTEITDLIESIQISEDGKRLAIGGAVPYNAITQIIDLILADSDSGTEGATSDDISINPVSEDDHIRGTTTAEIVLVEFSDFECPYCAQFHDTMKQVIDTYEANEVSWVYRQFPIPQLHPQAPRYAQASECIADESGNEAFWSYADQVFGATGGN